METNGAQKWSSYLGFIVAVAGAAVGLGNIWKFPYMVGDNGGSVFVILYLISVVFIGLPVMLSEMVIGRCGQKDTISSFEVLSNKLNITKRWALVGYLCCFTLLLAFSFYGVIAGFALSYLIDAIKGLFVGMSANDIHAHWKQLMSQPVELIFWSTLFMVLTLFIVARGVQKGIERVNFILMPALLIILVMLAGYSISLPGISKAIKFLFGFRMGAVTPHVVVSAMGHAFFSLAIGAGAMLVYGAYLPKRYTLGISVFIIAVVNVIVALLAGLAIFPLIFSYDLPASGGPGLMFEILPIAFSKMSGGYYVGILFFALLLFAALTSSISLAEPVVAAFCERKKISRLKAVFIVGAITWIVGLGNIFSFNIWEDVKLFGNRTYFLVVTDLVTDVLLPIGGFLFAYYAGWKLSDKLIDEQMRFPSRAIRLLWVFLVKYIAPLGIIVIMVRNILS